MEDKTKLELKKTATKVRMGIIAVSSAGSGHPGGSLSLADILTFLYFKEMNIDPKNPKNPDRDRFVLSKGHCTPALYSTLANRGFSLWRILLISGGAAILRVIRIWIRFRRRYVYWLIRSRNICSGRNGYGRELDNKIIVYMRFGRWRVRKKAVWKRLCAQAIINWII